MLGIIGAALSPPVDMGRERLVRSLVAALVETDANAVRTEPRIRVRRGAAEVAIVEVEVEGIVYVLGEAAAYQAAERLRRRAHEGDAALLAGRISLAARIHVAANNARFAIRTAQAARGRA